MGDSQNHLPFDLASEATVLRFGDRVTIEGAEWILTASVWPGGKPRFEKPSKEPIVTYPGGKFRADGLFELSLATNGHAPIPEMALIRLENYAGIFRVIARTGNIEDRTNCYLLKPEPDA